MPCMVLNLISIWAAGKTNQERGEQWLFLRICASRSTGMTWGKQVCTCNVEAGRHLLHDWVNEAIFPSSKNTFWFEPN